MSAEIIDFEEEVKNDYIVLTQLPDYKNSPEYNNQDLKDNFVQKNKVYMIDTGCVYGNSLTALKIDCSIIIK